jgi:hypothetical protein
MAQRKETPKRVNVRDLKPKKDAKGGVVPTISTQAHQQTHSIQRQGGPSPNRPGRP